MSTQDPPGKRTSLYLTSQDLLRIASAGSPKPIELVREALAAREAATRRPARGRRPAAPVATTGRGVRAAHAGRVTPAECSHPLARRDARNPNFCRACGSPVG